MAAFNTESFPNRKNSCSVKYDTLNANFGRDDLIPLWVADMDFPSPECIKEAFRTYTEFGVFGYYAPQGSYQDAFIDWEQKHHDLTVEREWIRFSPGVITGMSWAVAALTQPGDAVAILTPCYYPFRQLVYETERKLVCSELVCVDGKHYTVDFADLEEKIAANDVKVLLLCSPHNPIGHVWSKAELYGILKLCYDHKVVVISDEIHQDIVFPGSRHISSLKFEEFRDNVILFTSASKTFNVAGLQNSYGVMPNPVFREKYDRYMKMLHIKKGVSFGYIAAEAGYRSGEQWLSELLVYMNDNWKLLEQLLTAALPEIKVSPLEGTYMTWIDLSAYVKAEDLVRIVRDEAKLAVDYGYQFWPEELVPSRDAHIRINVAASRANIELAAKQLIAAIQSNM